MDAEFRVYLVASVNEFGELTVKAEMTGGDWDLTLFTCTIGGKKRITVRCTLTEE